MYTGVYILMCIMCLYVMCIYIYSRCIYILVVMFVSSSHDVLYAKFGAKKICVYVCGAIAVNNVNNLNFKSVNAFHYFELGLFQYAGSVSNSYIAC